MSSSRRRGRTTSRQVATPAGRGTVDPPWATGPALIGWAATDRGFYIDPRQAGYTVAFVIGRCWALRLRCAGCGSLRILSVAELQARFPSTVALGAIAKRLVCSRAGCGSHQGLAEFCQDHAATSGQDLALYQAGRGAMAPAP